MTRCKASCSCNKTSSAQTLWISQDRQSFRYFAKFDGFPPLVKMIDGTRCRLVFDSEATHPQTRSPGITLASHNRSLGSMASISDTLCSLNAVPSSMFFVMLFSSLNNILINNASSVTELWNGLCRFWSRHQLAPHRQLFQHASWEICFSSKMCGFTHSSACCQSDGCAIPIWPR